MVDALDMKILEVLKENARVPFAEIGRVVNLSPSTIRERIQRMEDTGVIIKHETQINQKMLGHDLEAFISIKVFHGQLKGFLEIARKFKGVEEAYRITGNQNVQLKVALKDQVHLQKLLDELMQYGDTQTHLILSQI